MCTTSVSRRRVLASLAAVSLAGCGGPTAPARQAPPTTAPAVPPTVGPVPPSPTAPPTVVVSGVADAPPVVRLVAELRRRGIDPTPAGPSAVGFLADAPGQVYQVGSGWLYLHPYPSAELATARQGHVRQGLAHPLADPPAPPHAFQCGAVIALYVGWDEQVTGALTEVCGPQFAGRG